MITGHRKRFTYDKNEPSIASRLENHHYSTLSDSITYIFGIMLHQLYDVYTKSYPRLHDFYGNKWKYSRCLVHNFTFCFPRKFSVFEILRIPPRTLNKVLFQVWIMLAAQYEFETCCGLERQSRFHPSERPWTLQCRAASCTLTSFFTAQSVKSCLSRVPHVRIPHVHIGHS